LATIDTHTPFTAATAFNDAIQKTQWEVWRMIFSSLNDQLLNLGYEKNSRVRIVAPSHLTCFPIHIARETGADSFLNNWITSYSSIARETITAHETGEKTILIVSNPEGDLDEPDWLKLVPADQKVVILRSDARTENVIEHLKTCETAVFFCHGYWDGNDPNNSRLSLGGQTNLSLSDLRGVQFDNNPTIVLACCESGLGNFHEFSYEARSFPEQMVKCGAKAVVAALWPIYVSSATLFLKHFFDALRRDSDFDLCRVVRDFQIQFQQTLDALAIVSEGAKSHIGTVREDKGKAVLDIDTNGLSQEMSLPVHWAGYVVYD
jgi:hypothetical protein